MHVCECVCVCVCVRACVCACVCVCVVHLQLLFPCLFQDIISGSELNKMVSVVEMMIDNHIDLFEVPAHVQLPARRYLKRKRGGEVSLSRIAESGYPKSHMGQKCSISRFSVTLVTVVTLLCVA